MTGKAKLMIIKTIHTLIWMFFNIVIFYFLYAVIVGKIDKWIWISLGLIALESLTLLIFRMMCPITVIARRYSDSTASNFDIFLPAWLAKYNKLIYSVIISIGLLILFYRLVW